MDAWRGEGFRRSHIHKFYPCRHLKAVPLSTDVSHAESWWLMAVYPAATYRPLNQFSNQGTKPRVGVVLHVNDSNGPSLYNWIAGNNNMSCHFQVAKSGVVEQYVDTDNGSWCQMAGNDTYLSIETEGYPVEALTAAQVNACAGIMRWANQTHGIPLQVADSVGARGLAWHGMGGAAWGGHTACPGDLRKAQRAQILQLALGDDMSQADVDAINAHTDSKFDAIGNLLVNDGTHWGHKSLSGKLDLILSKMGAGGNTVDVAALASALAADLGPDLSKELVAALGAAITKGSTP
jgi:hypothetical protein